MKETFTLYRITTLQRLLDLVAILQRDSSEFVVAELDQYLERWEEAEIWVAYHKRKPVGYAAWMRLKDRVLLDSVLILKPHRRKGLARLLLRKGEAFFGDVFYTLKVNNPHAKALYASEGWRVIGYGYDALGYDENVEYMGKGIENDRPVRI